MELREMYEICGGDLDKVMARLQSEVLVRKLLGMFLGDQSFATLDAAMAEQDTEKAFRAAHTLKGMTGDLGLENLYKATSALTEALRHEGNGDPNLLYQDVKESYEIAVNAIKQI